MFSSYLKFRTMDKVHKPSDSECYTPSAEPFRTYINKTANTAFDQSTNQTTNQKNKTEKLKLRGLSPRANYTERAKTACRRSQCQLLRIEGATWSAQRIPTAVFSAF
jgi:hypothetical protein